MGRITDLETLEGGHHPMAIERGWNPAIETLRNRFINVLTRRMFSLCEQSTSVYVPAATLSRVFCCAHIRENPYNVKGLRIRIAGFAP